MPRTTPRGGKEKWNASEDFERDLRRKLKLEKQKAKTRAEEALREAERAPGGAEAVVASNGDAEAVVEAAAAEEAGAASGGHAEAVVEAAVVEGADAVAAEEDAQEDVMHVEAVEEDGADDDADVVQADEASPAPTEEASKHESDEEEDEAEAEEEEAAAPAQQAATSSGKTKYELTCVFVKAMFDKGAFVHAIGKVISRNAAYCNKGGNMILDKNPYTVTIAMLQNAGVSAASIKKRLIDNGKGGTAAMKKVKG